MKFSLRKQIGKDSDLILTVPVRMPCWGLGEHEPLMIALFMLIVSRKNWKGPWIIRGSDWGRRVVRDFEPECK